ncbi:uncharacterized protein LOC135372664 [Ornithodoros turicata]|uniref:uncharacterized protein LOC135372664 n=1 Tax=Ornithodoros turicata TaxID=34597 RepID=UPI00313A0CA2
MSGELEKWIALGRSLGVRDDELREWVEEQRAMERQTRAEERAARAAERQLDERVLLAEERVLALRVQAANQATAAVGPDSSSTASERFRPGSHKVMPVFDEKRDDLDAYLHRFEIVAEGLRWPKEQWATALSLSLAGEALAVFGRLSPQESNDYEKVRDALLETFRYTAEGFREKFRSSTPDKKETAKQFGARLTHFFDKWVETSETPKEFTSLRDLMLREQFLLKCLPALVVFLKEGECKSLEETCKRADKYLEAQGLRTLGKAESEQTLPTKGLPKRATGPGCMLCGKMGHRASDCSAGLVKPKQSTCWTCGEVGHRSHSCPKNGRDSDRSGKAACMVSPGRYVSAAPNYIDYEDAEREGSPRALPSKIGLLRPVDGSVERQDVVVLRDTGSNLILVRRSLVPNSQMTGHSCSVYLADNTCRTWPEAEICVSSPYLTGKVLAHCVEEPIFDLIIGNVPGLVDIHEQLLQSAGQANEAATVGRREGRLLLEGSGNSAAVTRAQARQSHRNLPPLRVSNGLPENITVQQLADMQVSDHSLAKCFNDVGKKLRKSRCTTEYLFEIKERLLYRLCRLSSGREIEQLVVPLGLRTTVLREAHDTLMAGHQGQKRTADRILAEFFWPGVQGDVQRYVRSCDVCQRTVPKGSVRKTVLGSVPMISTPFQRVAVDIVGPISPPTQQGNRYILTLVDFATRYPEAVALRNIETVTVAEALVDMFSRLGVPREIPSDRGAQFTSDLMKEVARLLSLRQLHTTPYHPMANGMVEKFNGTLKQMLRRMSQEQPRHWDRYIAPLLFAYREVPQASLGFSPFELLYGRTVRGPLTILKELWTGHASEEAIPIYQYVLDLRSRLEATCKLAKEELSKAKAKQAGYYNRKARPRELHVGQPVLVLLPTEHNKLTMQWKGPYQVVKRRNDCDYEIQVGANTKVFHINILKQYVIRDGAHCAAVAVENTQEEEENVDISTMSLTQEQTFRDVKISADITRQQTAGLHALIEEYHDVFSDLPGRTDVLECHLRVTTDDPIQVTQYQIPHALQQTIEDEVQMMLRLGVIEKSSSAYRAPLVIVKKPDGSNRLCVDFRKLNDVLIFDAEPMARLDEMLAQVGNRKYFSKLDLSRGYWQIPMAESSKEKTAFASRSGLYHFRYMPFGLKTAAAVFTKLMREVLGDLPHVVHYIDDVLVATESWEEHLTTLKEIFRRVRAAHLTLKPKKCEFANKSVVYLGHTVGQSCITPNPDTLEKLLGGNAHGRKSK